MFFKFLFKKDKNFTLISTYWKKQSNNENLSLSLQPKKLKIKLFTYQLKSLNWMKQIEDSENTYKLYTKKSLCSLLKNDVFKSLDFDMFDNKFNSKNNFIFKCSGGILADEMGLGKTITSIALIIDRPYIYKPNIKEDKFNYEVKNINETNYLVTKSTLIICPSHLTKQWSDEITKCNPNLKQILILTKTNHKKYTYNDILNADIVITSFQFIYNINYYVNYAHYIDSKNKRYTKSWLSSSDYINNRHNDIMNLVEINKKSIMSNNIIFEGIFWNRIIIDEAHELFLSSYNYENMYLQHFLKKLHCKNKWYISGTPFYDKQSLNNVMNFLNFTTELKCNNNKSYFLNLEDSINYGLDEVNILNSIFQQIYIRNTKESVKDQLSIPNANIYNLLLDFSEFEKKIYNSLKIYNSTEYLRQICCNIQISSKFSNGDSNCIMNFNQVKNELIRINKDKIIKTQQSLNLLDVSLSTYPAQKKRLENIISSCKYLLSSFESDLKVSDESCPICKCEFEDPIVTSCGHNFCYECIEQLLNISSYKSECPICRNVIKSSNIFRLEENKIENKLDDLVYKYGTKLAQLIKLCNKILLNNKSKIIIFSEWDRLLTMIGNVLKENNILNVFCKGNVHSRNAAISNFRNNSKKNKSRVIMLSTEHAASGTNLTEATDIIFMESHSGDYNVIKTMEDQAIGRAVRLGQQNQVNVYRLIMKNTIEEDLFNNYINNVNV